MDNSTENPEVDINAVVANEYADATPTSTTQASEEASEVESKEVESKEDDFAWVPPKFLRDGKPDFQNLAKSYQNLEKKIGSKGAFAPDSVDEYVYEPVKVTFDEEQITAFKQDALSAGLSQKQYEFVLGKYEDAVAALTPSMESTQQYLEGLWGKDLDRNMEHVKRGFEAYVPSNIPLEAIGNNPYVIEILARIGAELEEDSVPSQRVTQGQGLDRDAINKIIRDPNYYRDKKLQQTVTDWYEKNSR